MTSRPKPAPSEVVAGNIYNKYGARNPIVRLLMRGFLDSLDELIGMTGASHVHEIGCGEGELSLRLAQAGKRVVATDLSSTIVAEASKRALVLGFQTPRILFETTNVYELEEHRHSAELIVCCEVLEHLPDPGRALRIISRLAKPHVVLSVPREPIWRILNLLRGRYVSRFGNTPGHLNHWSRDGFLAFVRTELDIVHVKSPLPWTMVLCRQRSSPRAGVK